MLFEKKVLKMQKTRIFSKVKMRENFFALNPMEEKQIIFSIKENITNCLTKGRKLKKNKQILK